MYQQQQGEATSCYWSSRKESAPKWGIENKKQPLPAVKGNPVWFFMKPLKLRCCSQLWATGKAVELKNSICTIPVRTIVETITVSHCKISLQFLTGVVSILPFLWLKQGPLEVSIHLNGCKKKAKRELLRLQRLDFLCLTIKVSSQPPSEQWKLRN